MLYAFVEDVAASWDTYEPVAADLERSLPQGLILHAAGRTDEGFRIIEIWESEDARRVYAAQADHASDGRLSTAARYRRDLAPSHLVIGREAASTREVHR